MTDAAPPRETGRIVLSQSTLLPIGAVFALAVALWTAKGYIDDKFTALDAKIVLVSSSLGQRLDRLEWRADGTNYWTRDQMRQVLLRWKALNPLLNVPDVSDVLDK